MERSLRVDVMAFEAPCNKCGWAMHWVFGLIPSWQPRPEEFTSTDFELAVDVARSILSAPDTDTHDLAEQLAPRPRGERGRSFNPNRCGACGHQAGWYALEGVINHAYHEGEIRIAGAHVPVSIWRAIRGKGQGIAWPVS